MRVKQVVGLIFVVILASMAYSGCLALDNVLRAMEKEFTRIIDDVSPAIVEITAIKGNVTKPLSSLDTREDVGTGIIIDRKGYIVTTESVVGGARRIGVNLADGRAFEAKIVGADPATDVALIKIDAEELSVASLGNSDGIRTGSWIVSIGRSYGKSSTLSFSIVSGVEPLPGRPAYYDAIKIGAAVSPGNSGGGVIDMDGNVVGIIAAVLAGPRAIDFQPYNEIVVADRIQPEQKQRDAVKKLAMQVPLRDRFFWRNEESFAIPINFAKTIIDDLMEHGKIRRGWLGIAIRDVKQENIKLLGLDTAEGVIVVKVFDNSPAVRAGVRKDDVIFSFHGKKIRRDSDLVRMVSATEPHTKADLGIIRGKEKQIFNVEIGEMPDNP